MVHCVQKLCETHCMCVFSMDLIAQYSRLSEEAAKKERRAMWKVQRMRLHEARVNFLLQDQHTIQVCKRLVCNGYSSIIYSDDSESWKNSFTIVPQGHLDYYFTFSAFPHCSAA